MPKKIGRYTLKMTKKTNIEEFCSVVGKKEGDGPIGKHFDKIFEDSYLGQSSWEKAEAQLQLEAVQGVLKKANLDSSQINYIFAGDLLNQCISSTFGLMDLGIPFLGQYGACSTMAQTLAMAAIMVDSGAAQRCIAVTSSHFCSAERQFRFPLDYGGQRSPSAQWTATASGSLILSSENGKSHVEHVTIGRITDLGIKDQANMGAAMAPAAARTLKDFFEDTSTSPADYDLILTGDLGEIGKKLLLELLQKDGIDISGNHDDCGLMIYDRNNQDVHAGGSGCGCSASILCSVILKKLKNKELRNILFVATGALMSLTSAQQGESIPGIAHLINIREFS